MLIKDLLENELDETIRKVKGGYKLVSKKTGKNLGTYPTRAGAEKREKQVQYFKHANEDANSDLAAALTNAEVTSYDAIDALMKKIAKQHNITAKELHDLWIKKYGQTPDDWIKAKLNEGPVWNKVKNAAIAGTMAGALGYGALTGQLRDKPREVPVNNPPLEINIPGADIAPTQKTEPKKQEKLEPSTATNANKEIEKIVLVSAKKAGIQGQELAQFMGQVAHETLGFQHLVELGSKEYFNRYDPKHSPKKAAALGNVKAGDGLRYKGRGFIHITGRDNYRRAGKALGIDLENNPKLASNPKVAAAIAVWYWNNRVRTEVKDFTDTIGVTAKVNPSMNGLGDRDMNFRHYLQKFQLED